MNRFAVLLAVALTLPLLHQDLAGEPQWHYPEFQEPAVEWLKSITEADVAVEVVPISLPELSEAEARLYLPASRGKYSLLSVVATQLSTPPEAYLWEGGIWRPDEPLIQDALRDESHGLESGQIWIPGHPNAANVLAWIYQLDEPWNPYYQNQAVAMRAVIISMVDLLVHPEQSFYWGDERSTKPGRIIHRTRRDLECSSRSDGVYPYLSRLYDEASRWGHVPGGGEGLGAGISADRGAL